MKGTDNIAGKTSKTKKATKKSTKKKSAKATSKKRLDMDALLTRVVELFVKHPPHTLTFSKVAQFADVPRSTLYYYFGKNFEDLLVEAVRFGAKAFVQIYDLEEELKSDSTQVASWEEFQRIRLMRSFEMVETYPWIPALYYRYRSDKGRLGSLTREIEELYFSQLAKAWEKYTGKEADMRAVRLSGYLKLGFMYGVSQERDLWKPDSNPEPAKRLVDKMTKLVTDVLNEKF